MDKQHELLLPVVYFLVTFTLPRELRKVARSRQRTIYSAFFRASAEALKELSLDPRFLGGLIGMVGVLQTWTRDMRYHPHIHYIVPGGGLSEHGNEWLPTRHSEFLVRIEPLAKLFRGRFKAQMRNAGFLDEISRQAWTKDWVVDIEPVGTADEALKYLAPYIYRIAITNNRIENLEDGQVAFRYKDSDTRQWHHTTIPVERFMSRFLQHVLPKGFQKVRYYGILAAKNRHLLTIARQLLGVMLQKAHLNRPRIPKQRANNLERRCPHCGSNMLLIKKLIPWKRAPPRWRDEVQYRRAS